MAETLLSPGVLTRENDQSQISSLPVKAGMAIVGPTVKGKTNIPTLVTTYSEYVANFGSKFESGSDEYSFLTSISAYNYFSQGGDSLLITKVGSGSFSPATSTDIKANSGLDPSTNGLSSSITSGPNITGSITGSVVGLSGSSNVGSGSGAVFSVTLSPDTSSISSITVTSTGSDYVVGEIITIPSESMGATTDGGSDLVLTLIADDIQAIGVPFVLETLSEGEMLNSTSSLNSAGALESGSADNIRWEILGTNTAKGVFTLILRQGNDNTKSKSILETFSNLSLDPKAPNYVARMIGDQVTNVRDAASAEPYLQTTGSFPNASRYVRVKSVNIKTPDYYDNSGIAKSQYTASIPQPQSGSFTGATGDIAPAGANFYENINNTNTQGLVPDNYTVAFNLLNNPTEYQFNVLTAPGLVYSNATHTTPLNTVISNVESRGDVIFVVDLENYDSTVTAVTTTAAAIDSSYTAAYWPWVQITDPDTAQLVWIPASTLIPGIYAKNDKYAEPWFAPAGFLRGGLGNVRQTERKLTATAKNNLYVGKVNPLATFPGRGVVVFGQKTLQTKATALDRVNVRRLLIEAKSHIKQIADNFVFEQNTASTRNSFLAQTNPYLESIQQRQGLYAFKVVMDETNNGPDVIDRNQLNGAIYLQPTRTAEFIYLDFNILPTGAVFPV